MEIKYEVQQWSRRNFIKAALGCSALATIGQFGLYRLGYGQQDNQTELNMILVDYSKCTGCRTCETVCSAYNHRQEINGEVLNGLGNPDLANIQVYPFNPDVDIPVVCTMCPDTPCIEACPVDPDPNTGRKALYREENNQTITNDPKRCISCGSCAEACRTGIIRQNAETERPEHMCTLCGGDTQCVKYCPFEALSLVKVDTSQKFYARKPEQIAQQLIHDWYGVSK